MNALLFASLLLLENAPMPAEEALQRFQEHVYAYTGGEYKNEQFGYRLLEPARIEPGKQYPVVLFLHGAGERGTDNNLQLLYFPEQMAADEYREKYPCFLIAPQCRPERTWTGVSLRSKSSQAPDEPGDQLQVALGILDEVLANYPADPKRVYLTGLSMGGFATWDAAARFPKRFAAVVPICGGGDESKAQRLVKLPIWAVHGDKDEAVPVERTRKMIEAVRRAGGEPKYTELEGVGHNSWTPAYSDPEGVLPWMFQQRME